MCAPLEGEEAKASRRAGTMPSVALTARYRPALKEYCRGQGNTSRHLLQEAFTAFYFLVLVICSKRQY